jgi:hypothetical protein
LGAVTVVVSQDPVGAGLQKVQPLRLLRLSQARLIGQVKLLVPAVQPSAYTDVNGQSFVGGRNGVAVIGEEGKGQVIIQTSISRPTLSPMGQDKILIGDLDGKRLFTAPTKGGGTQLLLNLSEVKSKPTELLPYSEALKGEFMSAASDGKFVYVAFAAGFSSSIYKIDPATKAIIFQNWATAADPAAMTFHDGALYMLCANGRQVRRFSDSLVKSHDQIDLPFGNAKGLGIRSGGEIRTLSGPTQIARVQVDQAKLSRTSLAVSLDRIRLTRYVPVKIKFPPLNFPKRYAVLICGDLAENFAGECFWNDTVWMYKTLRANGYAAADIFVLYGDGVDYMSANPYYRNSITVTDFAASPAKVTMVLNGLKNGDAANGIPKMDSNDTLFLWTFDHGGQSGGQSTLCLRGGNLLASNFNTLLNAIPYSQRAVFMQQCFSGGFIPGLKNSKTFISTACRSDEVARPADTENETYNGKQYSHGEFNYHITTALNRLKTSPPGGAIDADTNNDNFVASKEMHTWNVGHESRPETPQGDDMGGIGSIFKFKK